MRFPSPSGKKKEDTILAERHLPLPVKSDEKSKAVITHSQKYYPTRSKIPKQHYHGNGMALNPLKPKLV
jgi:hypothetical protein